GSGGVPTRSRQARPLWIKGPSRTFQRSSGRFFVHRLPSPGRTNHPLIGERSPHIEAITADDAGSDRESPGEGGDQGPVGTGFARLYRRIYGHRLQIPTLFGPIAQRLVPLVGSL